MKFNPDTITKPVVGDEAKRLSKAIKEGNSIINEQSLETLDRILKRRQEWVKKVLSGEIKYTKGKRIA